jgi:D-alanyl-D-alanine carboxypeptidase
MAVAAALSFTLVAMAAAPALARSHRHGSAAGAAAWNALSATDPVKDAALVIDGETGKVLYARNADAERHPASLTKMMTLYLLFEQLHSGQMAMTTELPVSEHAAEQAPTKLHMWPGSTIPVDTAIRAIVVWSANDVAVAIAEAIGGTESHFAEMMTDKARQLGMSHTFYHNASGLPDELQVTTARDLGILARHLAYDFPQYFHYFSTPSFEFRGQFYRGHDNLLGNYEGADGIKTGYTSSSGFNLVSSVVRDGSHVIGVVMGGRSAHKRDMEMVRLLDDTFAQITQNPTMVARANVPWQSMAYNNRPAVVASLSLPSVGMTPTPAPTTGGTLRITPNGEIDEDAAESRADPDDDRSVPVSNVPDPIPAPAAPPPPPKAVIAQTPQMKNVIIPTPRPNVGKGLVLASYQPATLRNVIVPVPRDVAARDPQPATTTHAAAKKSGGGIAPATAVAANQWTIQIGAFADVASAKAQLSAYAERSMDVLGQAQRIVAPFQGVDGRMLYRARFGPFVEKEARAVCQRLTERGQTCFAATYQQ